MSEAASARRGNDVFIFQLESVCILWVFWDVYVRERGGGEMEIRRNKWSFIHLVNVGGNYEVTVHKHKAGLTENRSREIW